MKQSQNIIRDDIGLNRRKQLELEDKIQQFVDEHIQEMHLPMGFATVDEM
jgi:hypothetical protein